MAVASFVAFLSAGCGPGPVASPDAQNVDEPDAGEELPGEDVQAQVPSPPRNVVATPGNGSATVTWTEPAANGGRAVTGYVVTVNDGTTHEATKTNLVVEGLTNGTAYTFRVVARNAIGVSAPSETSIAVTPFTVPGSPTEVVATPGVASARVTWLAPADDGGSPVTGYVVAASNGSVRETTATSLDYTGLVNGATYTFVVVALNAAGQGASSAPSNQVAPVSVPGAPSGVLAERGDGKAVVSWVAPLSDGGSPITHYVVAASDGATRQSTATTVDFDGLVVGLAYSFTVVAFNQFGGGPVSIPSNEVVTVTVPGPPRDVVAHRGDGNVTLEWSPPASDGGSRISQYDVHCSDGRVLTSASTELFVEDLTNGEAYTFTVVAVNAVGEGPASEPTEEVTPSTVPGRPTDVVVTRGDGSLTLTWKAPEWDGGSPVISYLVRENFATDHAVTGTTLTLRAAPQGRLIVGFDYAFTVVAVNDVGEGASSLGTEYFKVISRPAPPTSVTAARGNASATVSWSPGWDGGGTFAGYRVTANDGSTWDATASPTLIEGLVNGTPYTFTVATLSEELGASAPSPSSNAVTPATVPKAPNPVTATAGRKSAQVTWTAPDNGGSTILHYLVTPKGGTAQTATGTSLQVTGLQNGTPYTFLVEAVNDLGKGAASAPSNQVVPVSESAPPRDVVAALDPLDGTSVIVSWQPPESDEGSPITGYVVTSSAGGTPYEVSGLELVVDGLTIGAPVTFGVQARNGVGLSASSAQSNTVVPVAVPGAPAEVNARAQAGKVLLDWAPPGFDGGTPVIGYRVTSSTSQQYDVPAANTSLEVTGLTNGTTYTFTVQARNSVGYGPGTASASVKPVAVPTAPRTVAVALEDTGIRVTWEAPVSNGGEPLTRYLVTLGLETMDVGPTVTSAHFPLLTEGTIYTSKISAENAIGRGPEAGGPSLTYLDREWAQWKIPSVGSSGFTTTATTVTDSRTKLTWQRDPGLSMSWDSARTYCDALTVSSYTDWRLPTLIELSSIIDFSRTLPAIDTTVFRGPSGSSDGRYWSATTYAPLTTQAWVRNVDDGSRDFATKTISLAVRCVR